MTGVLRELYRRSPVLCAAAWLHAALFAAAAAAALFDDRMILGINPWIKPMKFMLSIAIYTATLGWLLGGLSGPRRPLRVIGWGVAIAMFVEIVCIAGQSWRGVPSHFNVLTPFDGAVFRVMGVMIVLNTALVGYTLVLYFTRHKPMTPAYLWGVRLGLAIFIVASLEGFVMVARAAHAVGAPDGGPGLPFVNWSLEAGDLRIAHFLGLHALQVLPFAGWLVARAVPAPRKQVWTMFAAAAIYFGLVWGLFAQAMAGLPLVRL